MVKKETRKTTGTGARRGQAAKKTGARQQPARGEGTGGADTATATISITHEQIAERAKRIWEERGRPQGEDERNWREAERQLKEETGSE